MKIIMTGRGVHAGCGLAVTWNQQNAWDFFIGADKLVRLSGLGPTLVEIQGAMAAARK